MAFALFALYFIYPHFYAVLCCCYSYPSSTNVGDTLVERFMKKPVRILVKKNELTLEGIKRFYIAVEREEWKFDVDDQHHTSDRYCNTRRKVDWLQEEMKKKDFTVSCMHGGMDERERGLIMRTTRTGSSRVLITTDLLARGIDVRRVSLVINFDLSPYWSFWTIRS